MTTDEMLKVQDIHDGLMAEIARLKAGRDWQPIETAPKDGSSFLACSGIWMTVCHWHRHQLCWSSVGPVYSSYPRDEQPTHWMPLPEPPRDAQNSPQREDAP